MNRTLSLAAACALGGPLARCAQTLTAAEAPSDNTVK